MGCLRALYPIVWVAWLGNGWFPILHCSVQHFQVLSLTISLHILTITRDFLQVEFAPFPGVKNEVHVKTHRESNIIPRYFVQMGCLRALYPIVWVAWLGNGWFPILHCSVQHFQVLSLTISLHILTITRDFLQVEFAPFPGVKNEDHVKMDR